jgi:hypothetical protein
MPAAFEKEGAADKPDLARNTVPAAIVRRGDRGYAAGPATGNVALAAVPVPPLAGPAGRERPREHFPTKRTPVRRRKCGKVKGL